MKRKSIYSLVLICFIGLLSSANQSNQPCCKQVAWWQTAKANCGENGTKTAQADAGPVPLNLFLFDL